MAFEEFKRTSPGNSTTRINNQPDRISISVSGKKALNMSIVVGSALLAERGWLIGDKFTVYFGTGEDKGKLLLKKSENGVTMTVYSKKTTEGAVNSGNLIRKVSPIAPIADFCNTQIPRELVEHKWDPKNGGVMVDLPQAFFSQSAAASSSTDQHEEA